MDMVKNPFRKHPSFQRDPHSNDLTVDFFDRNKIVKKIVDKPLKWYNVIYFQGKRFLKEMDLNVADPFLVVLYIDRLLTFF